MKSIRKILSVILCCCILLGLAAAVVLPRATASVADDLEESMLGELSAKYESNGNPGAIATVSGDPGGKSYGLYMFSSAADTPKAFFQWCQASSNAYYQGIGNALSEAYYYGTPGYGPLFDQAWRDLAADNSAGFGRAQRDYVRADFYDKYVAAISSKVSGFSVSNYSIALRNVLWSRAIQHGVGGAVNVFTRAMDSLGGFTNQPESTLINAIYAESGRLTDTGSIKMTGPSARRYGVEGKSLAYYSSCSSDVQLGVYIRLRINEPANAQAMLAEYGYGDAPVGEGSYLICPADNDNLAVTPGSSGLIINKLSGDDNQQFRLTYYASGYYIITDNGNAQRLTAGNGGVKLAAPSTDNAQFWVPVPLNSGFALQNRATGQYLSASSFSAGGSVTLSSGAAQWQLVPGDANWSLTGASYPTYASGLQVGSSTFPFRGILRSTYPITKVRAEVQDDTGTTMFYAEARPNTLYYDLSQMDSRMTFGRLGSGSYYMIITASDSSGGHFELKEPFFVSGDTFTVYFDANGGKCDVTSMTFVPGQVLGDLPIPTKEGKAFAGWYDEEGNLFTGASVTPAHDMTLTARYDDLYTYTFYDYDGKTVLSRGQLTYGSTIPLPSDPSRAATSDYYYTFAGWKNYTPGMTMPAKNISFTAVYDEHPVVKFTEMVSNGTYHLVDGYLRAIPAGTTAEDILSSLTPREYITIHKDGKAVTGKVGTGMTVDFAPEGKIIQSVAIVITGDVNGDGNVTLTDMVQIRAHLLGRSTLKGAALQAADLNGDGQLTLTDMVQLRSYMLGRSKITPR